MIAYLDRNLENWQEEVASSSQNRQLAIPRIR